VQVRSCRAGAYHPRLGVEPLKAGSTHKDDLFSVGTAAEVEEVAIFHASNRRKTAPAQFSILSMVELWSTRLPSPNETTSIMSPMPNVTPKRHGRPLATPVFAPAAVSMTLLGPGVIAATTAKRRREAAYSKHRHDTYAIGLTDSGVQAFQYGGAVHISTLGQVVILYLDEMHDWRAGSSESLYASS
jgi:hypothetical protein